MNTAENNISEVLQFVLFEHDYVVYTIDNY
jgi:hypothetical protein